MKSAYLNKPVRLLLPILLLVVVADSAFAQGYGPDHADQAAGHPGILDNATATPIVGIEPDPRLSVALAQALSSHPSIAAAQSAARAAGADLRAARWLRFPSVSVEGQFLDQRGNTLQPAATVEQPLWAGGRISGSIRRARHLQAAALARHDATVLEIALGVVQSWHDVLRLTRREVVLAESRDQHRRLVETMERRVAQEVSPVSDYELVRSRLSQAEQQLNVVSAQRLSALQRLRELVGDQAFVPAGELSPPAAWPTLDRDAVLTAARTFSPQLQQLRAEAQAAEAEVSISRAQILPQLNGQYTYSEFYGHRVGLVLRAQSDGGLSRFAAADAARQRQQASELQIAAGERSLRDQVVTDHLDYQSARSRLDSSQFATAAAGRVRESYMRQFVSGRRTWLDVMNAVREATTAEIEAIDTEASALAALSRLMLRTGNWQSETEAPAK